jgi:hypothetical protein
MRPPEDIREFELTPEGRRAQIRPAFVWAWDAEGAADYARQFTRRARAEHFQTTTRRPPEFDLRT